MRLIRSNFLFFYRRFGDRKTNLYSMALISDLIRLLDKQETKAEFSNLFILNYLKFSGFKENSKLTSELLDSVVGEALQFDYWIKKKKELVETLIFHLEKLSLIKTLDLDLVKLHQSLQAQVITLVEPIETISVVSRYLKRKREDSQQIKIKVLDNHQVMALILNENNILNINVYSNKMKVSGGQLLPLTPITVLRYNAYMELQFDSLQKVKNEQMTHYFSVNHNGALGYTVRGPQYQLGEKFSGLFDYSFPAFYLLKGLERHYIDLASDPFYKEVCMQITKSINLLKLRSAGAHTYAKKALKSGFLASKYVFKDDKHIGHLLLELERTIQSELECLPPDQKQITK